VNTAGATNVITCHHIAWPQAWQAKPIFPNFAAIKTNGMETIIITAEEWTELSRKIDRITDLMEQQAEREARRLPADGNAWLNEKQVCEYLKTSSKTLQRLRKSGEVAYSTIGKKHFYKADGIKSLLEKKTTKSNREHLEKLRSSQRTLNF
jgi:hypothetical protein